MRATEFLTELFDRALPYKWVKATGTQYVAKFQAENRMIVVTLNKDATGDGVLLFQDEKQSEGNYKKTGKFKKTSPVKVFATIASIVNDYIEYFHPNNIFFQASLDESSRVSLYTRLVNTFHIPGYSVRTYVRPRKETDDKGIKDSQVFNIYKN